MAPEPETFSAHFTVYLQPTDVPKFFSAMQPAFDAISEEEDLLYYEMFEHASEPGRISWIENWSC